MPRACRHRACAAPGHGQRVVTRTRFDDPVARTSAATTSCPPERSARRAAVAAYSDACEQGCLGATHNLGTSLLPVPRDD